MSTFSVDKTGRFNYFVIKMKTKKNICGIVIGLLGLSLLTLGIISFIYVPMMIKSYVFDALMDLMHEDSEQYANFVSFLSIE